MRSEWLQRSGRPQALLFFAGWGMDDRPFRRLTSSNYDVCVCFDYRHLPNDLYSPEPAASTPRVAAWRSRAEAWKDYDRLAIVAWSFGCAAAGHVMAAEQLDAQQSLAINGTLIPEDPELGISTEVLDATSENLPQGGWAKFARRMCGSREACAAFQQQGPHRDLRGAIDELADLRRLPVPPACGFTQALVSSRDRIISSENQQRCWDRFGVPVRTINASHYPFPAWSTWEEVLASGFGPAENAAS